MTDEAGAAVAASEPVATPSEQAPQGDVPAPADRSKEPARASIDRAFAALDGQEAAGASPAKEPKPAKEAKDTKEPIVADTRQRDESGRFVAKDTTGEPAPIEGKPDAKASTEKPAATATEPPSRFSADAKAAWKDAPPAVQGEIARAIKELEGGLSQYQQVFDPLKKHFVLAKQNNTTVHEALDRYIDVERSLRSHDVNHRLLAIEGVFETAGISPRDYAAHIMGQKPEQAQSQTDATIRAQNARIAELEQRLGGVSSTIQERHHKEVETFVADFAKEHSRLNDHEFANTVSRLISTGMADGLQSAYDMADRLNPAPVVQQPAATTAQPNPDQTRKGQLSIAGAPASGSNPAIRKTPATARDALNNAFSSLGIG